MMKTRYVDNKTSDTKTLTNIKSTQRSQNTFHFYWSEKKFIYNVYSLVWIFPIFELDQLIFLTSHDQHFPID